MQADLFSKAFSQHLPMSHIHKALESGSLSERLENLRVLGFRGPKPRKTCWAGSVFLGCVTGMIWGSPLTQKVCFAAPTPWKILLTYSCWLESQSPGVYQLSSDICRLLWHVVTKLGSMGLGADCLFMAVAVDAIFRSLVQMIYLVFFCCQVSYF